MYVCLLRQETKSKNKQVVFKNIYIEGRVETSLIRRENRLWTLLAWARMQTPEISQYK